MLHRNMAAGRGRCAMKNPMRTTKMAKNKTAGEKINGAAQTAETTVKNGAEAFKTGFEKAVKNYDHFLGYGKETVEAYVNAANAAGKGAATISSEICAFSEHSIEDAI